MAYIDFRKLKERVSIRDILDHYGLLEELEETDQGFKGACPFCGSNALKVSTEKNAWYCFGECKTNAKDGERYGGNILDLVARTEGVSVKRAAGLIAGWFPPPDAPQQSQNNMEKYGGAKAKKKAEGTEPEKETEPAIQEDRAAETQEETPERNHQPGEDGVGEGVRSAEDTSHDTQPDLTGIRNLPLDFALKSIDVEHSILESLGLQPETLAAFEVGYFTGKGSMAGKVVLPFHNSDGLLVAYAGYSPKDGSIRYPKQFDRRLELYNLRRADIAGIAEDGLTLVTDLINVLRLYELGVHRVVALPTSTLYAPQIEHIRGLVGDGGALDFVPWTPEYSDNLRILSEHFHVRLHRYYQGSEDEFLSQVATSLRW